IRLDKRDRVFSELIRLRDWNTCQRCGKTAHSAKIECSHIFSRRHQATRFAMDNAVAHCFTCHDYLGGAPVEFDAWARRFLGEGRLEMLRVKHRQICKRTEVEREELYQHLRG